MGNIVNPAGYQKSKEALKMSSDTDGWANSISTYIKDGGDVNAVAALVSTSAFFTWCFRFNKLIGSGYNISNANCTQS